MPNPRRSYFALPNPLKRLDRWLNPPHLSKTVNLKGFPLDVAWTRRAEQALEGRESALLVELQLYFSCVVKKRVLFHEQPGEASTKITDKLSVSFHVVQSEDCDPEEFARSFPVEQEFDSDGARAMNPKRLLVDYRNGEWFGEYWI